MTEPSPKPVKVPTPSELASSVVPRPKFTTRPEPIVAKPEGKHAPKATRLSPESHAVLRFVARNPGKNQKETFAALGLYSGSTQTRIMHQLHDRYGFVRREREGRSYILHATPAGLAYLAEACEEFRGVGGDPHKRWAEWFRRDLLRRGYTDVRIECPVGPRGKRVDVLAQGRQRVAVEIGMSSADQEFRNLTLDLESGVLDRVLMVSPNPKLVAEVRRRAEKDPYLRGQLDKVRFLVLDSKELDS